MTEVEFQSIITEQRKKNLKAKDLPLVVFEWLVLLNERSAGDYKTLYQYKIILNCICFLSLLWFHFHSIFIVPLASMNLNYYLNFSHE